MNLKKSKFIRSSSKESKDSLKVQIGGRIELDESSIPERINEIKVRMGTLFKADNLSFLIGAGASIEAGGFSIAGIPETVIDSAVTENLEESFLVLMNALLQTEAKEISQLYGNSGSSSKNIPYSFEIFLSKAFMWLASIESGANITLNKKSVRKDDLELLLKRLKVEIAKRLDLPSEGKEAGLETYKRFMKKILTRPLNLRRANLFTLNNDTLIEKAADATGTFLVDGFIGTMTRVFRPDSYDLDFYYPAQTTEGKVHRFDRAMHLYKLHGSIHWHRTQPDANNPYGIVASFFKETEPNDDLLIYPTPLKYGQAMDFPYSELFRRFGNAIVQQQSVLFVIGYGFGDAHVNALITQALALPSFTLVIVDPEPKSNYIRKLRQLKDERVWLVEGWSLGTFANFVNKLLPDLREEDIQRKVSKTHREIQNLADRDQGVY